MVKVPLKVWPLKLPKEEVERMRKTRDDMQSDWGVFLIQEIDRLKAINAELLAALNNCMVIARMSPCFCKGRHKCERCKSIKEAQAAIVNTEEKKP